MSTKINPGRFNCYAAAMPDEPIFTILARDPAFPATVDFWRSCRIDFGKNKSDDDLDRLVAAKDEADAAVRWREANLVGPDGEPTWRAPRQFVTDEPPIAIDTRVPRYLNHDEVVADLREIVEKYGEGTLYNDYDRATELLGVLREVVNKMSEPVESNTFNTDFEAGPLDVESDKKLELRNLVLSVRDKLGMDTAKTIIGELGYNTLAVMLDDTARHELNAAVFKTVLRHVDVEPRKPSMLSDMVQEVVDRIDARMKTVEDSLGRPSNSASQKFLKAIRQDLLVGCIRGEDPIPVPVKQIIVEGVVRVGKGEYTVQELERLVEIAERAILDSATPGERVIIDSAPEDLAHQPEVPPHRFSMFNKGEHYAYARGLEINPSHLPTALDALLKDGWELISLFGQTDSEHVGFIFKRVAPPMFIFEPDSSALEDYMTTTPPWPRGDFGIDPERYRKSEENHRKLGINLEGLGEPFDPMRKMTQTFDGPKIEVHIGGMAETDALKVMAVIECRLQWLPQDYESVRIVGLIARDPEAAFDFTQQRGKLDKRKSLINGNCGDMELGRQQEP